MQMATGNFCKVDGCHRVLFSNYCRKHQVCRECRKAARVHIQGDPGRWCQQCARFHPLSYFEGAKRTCREKLALMKQRRLAAEVEDARALADMASPQSAAPSSTQTSSGCMTDTAYHFLPRRVSDGTEQELQQLLMSCQAGSGAEAAVGGHEPIPTFTAAGLRLLDREPLVTASAQPYASFRMLHASPPAMLRSSSFASMPASGMNAAMPNHHSIASPPATATTVGAYAQAWSAPEHDSCFGGAFNDMDVSAMPATQLCVQRGVDTGDTAGQKPCQLPFMAPADPWTINHPTSSTPFAGATCTVSPPVSALELFEEFGGELDAGNAAESPFTPTETCMPGSMPATTPFPQQPTWPSSNHMSCSLKFQQLEDKARGNTASAAAGATALPSPHATAVKERLMTSISLQLAACLPWELPLPLHEQLQRLVASCETHVQRGAIQQASLSL